MMTKEESIKYIKSNMCRNCSIYLGGGKCSETCSTIEAIRVLEQEPIKLTLKNIREDLFNIYMTPQLHQQINEVLNKYGNNTYEI